MINKEVSSTGDYVRLYDAVFALFAGQPATDDYHIFVAEDTIETTWAAIAGINLNGHTVTITAAPHGGSHLAATKIQVSGATRCVFRPTSGTFIIENLYFQQVTPGGDVMVQLYMDGGNVTFQNNFIDGNGRNANGLSLYDGNGTLKVLTNNIWDCTTGLIIDYHSNAFVENNIIYKCSYGVSDGWGGTAATLKNVVSFGCLAEDWNGTYGGNSHLVNCAASDNTIVTEFTDRTACLANVVTVNEYNSLDDTAINFLTLKADSVGVLAYSGAVPTYVTVDITGLSIPYNGNCPIGSGVSQSSVQNISSNISSKDAAWHHVALKYRRTGTPHIWIYIDGILRIEQDLPSGWSFSGAPMQLGQSVDDNGSPSFWEKWKGALDDVRFYNRVLTDAEVFSIYEQVT